MSINLDHSLTLLSFVHFSHIKDDFKLKLLALIDHNRQLNSSIDEDELDLDDLDNVSAASNPFLKFNQKKETP